MKQYGHGVNVVAYHLWLFPLSNSVFEDPKKKKKITLVTRSM